MSYLMKFFFVCLELLLSFFEFDLTFGSKVVISAVKSLLLIWFYTAPPLKVKPTAVTSILQV